MFCRLTLILIITLISMACSACGVTATTRQQVTAKDPASPAVPPPSATAPARLACEPLGLVNLAPTACAGTSAADPAFDDAGTCVCRNTDYAAVPNGLGKTCVHVEAIAALMRVYADFLERAGIPDPVIEIEPYVRVELTESGFELHHAPPPKKILVEASWFKRDVNELLQNIRAGIPRDAIECRIGRIQRAAATFINERTTDQCIAIAPKEAGTPRI
jgi:hypothetical protein